MLYSTPVNVTAVRSAGFSPLVLARGAELGWVVGFTGGTTADFHGLTEQSLVNITGRDKELICVTG